jgi:hypothetical protein
VTYANEDKLKCDGWTDGEANGRGVGKFANGRVFEGKFKNGCRLDKGVEKFATFI